jgi:hypothetical protein
MPSTIELALVVLGAILILISVLGGKFKIFGADIEGSTDRFGRIIAFVLGLIFIFIAIVMDYSSLPDANQSASQPQTASSSSTGTPALTAIPASTSISASTATPASTAFPIGLSAPSGNTVLPPVTPSANISCPAIAGDIYSLSPNQWIGPLTLSGASYDITYDQNYIYIWDINNGKGSSYNNPASQDTLNQWNPISGTPFTICEDASSNFYAAFSQ